ncbi:MAG: hypothetical protein IAE86_02340 [Burkholderiaceae bacterium]|nr:hypothetical protein [Burkholderiaceae bacterium]
MTARRFILSFVALGILVPAAWFIFYWTIGKAKPDILRWIMLNTPTHELLLLLCPSSLLMMMDAEDKSYWLPVITIALNALLYAILGWLFWIGIKRSRIVLIGTAAVVLVGWYGLLNL